MAAQAQEARIAPSILSANFCCLESELKSIETADYVHFDVMDGHFVPNHSFGPDILKAAKRATDLPLDVHLMITNPDELAMEYVNAGADIVTFHFEATHHAHRLIYSLKDAGVKAGIAINPQTSVNALEEIISDVDLILIMCVNPGFGGQSFIGSSFDKLRRLRELMLNRGSQALVEVDGGIALNTAFEVCKAGADVLAAGSAIFGASSREQAIFDIRQLANDGINARK